MKTHIIGIISDTHSLLRPEALDALQGAELILHAGDIGTPTVLEALAAIAPVIAIRGNVDKGKWALEYPETRLVPFNGRTFYMLHDLKTLDIDPVAAGVSVVISGHSHIPSMEQKDGVLYLNPGSAGPRRFNLPVSIARVEITAESLNAHLVELPV